MIRVSNLYKSFGRSSRALIDINFEIEKEGFVFICGPTGAGKTTLLRLLYLDERPDRGRITVMGRDLSALRGNQVSLLRRQMGIMFQPPGLIPERTVFDNIAVALRIRGVPSHRIRGHVLRALDLVGLAGKRGVSAGSLSAGEGQMLALARAVANDPPIILADEPTEHLDPEARGHLIQLLKDKNAAGCTVLIAAHNPDEPHQYGGRALFLENGRLV